MTTATAIQRVTENPNYLGSVDIVRKGEAVPATLHVVRPTTGRMQYFDFRYTKTNLLSSDRAKSTAVVADAPASEVEALREALIADRWVNVTVRG